MASLPLLAAVDFGTTGVRTLIVDIHGQARGGDMQEVSIQLSPSGQAEQSLETFWSAFVAAWKTTLDKSGVDPNHILALGFSHQRCSFALADRSGLPLTNLIVWMDRRGIPYLESWHQNTPLASYYEITGLPIYYISSLSKILWFQDQAPSLFNSAAHIWPIASFIAARMGVKKPPLDHATASFYGLMDTRERVWSASISQAFDLDQEMLPDLVPSGTMIGRLSDPQAAGQLGLPLGLPLVIGGGDQQCAALGSGMIHPGHSLINLGTATALMASVNTAVRDPNHIIPCVCHAAPGHWEMEGHTQASGVILQRFRDEFGAVENQLAQQSGRDIYDLLTEQASQSSPGSSGLLFLPMFNGSTAPVDEPQGAGSLIGLKLSHTRADLLRAILEGICLENRWILEAIQHSGVLIEKTSITGGASKSAFWNQLHADILRSPVTQVKTSNAALIGAIICAGLGVGVFANIEEAVDIFSQSGATYYPDPNTSAVYDHLYQQFVNAYSSLCTSGVYKELRGEPDTKNRTKEER